MFEELALGGLLFSPLVVFVPMAFILSCLTRFVLHTTGVYHLLWKAAWFEVGLFVCYLAVVVHFFGS
ncbi:DUF1656 domain-containing protein [Vibrio fluvialis]|jgi:hypothetical protein|uniref:DUF1656 domain-containing protein n=2 Tax=Vibrio fluvialis TaxID=676 RepID=A0AAX2LVM2_VIBFL|nr:MULTISPECIES: DUF1656 domain-containing protein [Vibrio]TNF10420.1 MAG: DUF1656 domain-containing protein [Vibrionaceae bacterium]HDM8033266.1 DUF1656 domain-containing protein [Vibrio fluvialis clinical-1]AMF92211.1 DUF1656 domain-containing protein [Vibrio fluvialis]AVH33852.1 DUF1656 domain-containing protein [Vibrio fluvialis]EKO3367244.1 DUF1656 domain-containing protein [Vibrio fluvialis]